MIRRTARHSAVCGAPGCYSLVFTGTQIVKPPGGAWRHADCQKAAKRSRPDRDMLFAPPRRR